MGGDQVLQEHWWFQTLVGKLVLGLPLLNTTCCTGSALIQVHYAEKRSGRQSCYAAFKCSQALIGVVAEAVVYL